MDSDTQTVSKPDTSNTCSKGNQTNNNWTMINKHTNSTQTEDRPDSSDSDTRNIEPTDRMYNLRKRLYMY